MPGLIQWLRAHNYDFIVDPETAPHAAGAPQVSREEMAARKLEFIIVLGGDGTLLSAARAVAKAGIPILGINLGALGFLTEVPLEELYPALDSIENGSCTVHQRSMVHCEVSRSGSIIARYDALNDVVVGKGTIARLNHCDVYIDKIFVSRYQADSLIVSSPTGSTAYSLAAGGPILMPDVEAFVITPVSAHSLTHRPLVVRDTSEIEIVVLTGRGRGLPQHRRPGRHAHARRRPRLLPQVAISGEAPAHQRHLLRRAQRQAQVGTAVVAEAKAKKRTSPDLQRKPFRQATYPSTTPKARPTARRWSCCMA